MSNLITEARNSTLEDMLAILRDQQARKIDLVLPAGKIRFTEADLQLKGLDPIFEEDGLTDPNGLYRPTRIFDEKLADYLKIPTAYVRRLREDRPDLYDLNANGLLHGRNAKLVTPTAFELGQLGELDIDNPPAGHLWNPGTSRWNRIAREAIPGDARSFLLRLFRGDDGQGVARAILSDRYKVMENLDGLMALLAGIKEAGIDPAGLRFDRCDLTERRMYVKVTAPEIQAAAPELLKGYRNPFAQGVERAENLVRGREIDDWRRIAAREGMAYTEEEGGEPVVFAGFIFSNSEVGGGKWTVQGCIEVQICKNGLTFAEDAFGRVHLGGRMDEGVVNWSDDTQDKNLALVSAQTRDAVQQFLSPTYVEEKVQWLEERTGHRLTKPADDIKVVAKKLSFSEDQTAGILEHFMLGGQITAGGLMQAITSYSQTVIDPDEAYELDAKAVRALEFAAAL
jgi:hypothetical protein